MIWHTWINVSSRGLRRSFWWRRRHIGTANTIRCDWVARARSCRRRETRCSLSHIGHLELSQALRISQRECWTSLVARNSMCNHTHYCMPGQRSRGTRKVWSCASEHGGSIKKVSHITTCFDSYSSMGEVQRVCNVRVCAQYYT